LLKVTPEELPSFKDNVPVYQFKESELITHVLKENVTDESFFQNISQSHSDLEVQITEIAINEGSTKSFIHATLTETIQNSLDAIREVKSLNDISGSFNDSISLFLKQSETHLIYQITDYVGVPFEGIVSMMIPFLSSKTPSQIVPGK
jgi:hypothetical protein